MTDFPDAMTSPCVTVRGTADRPRDSLVLDAVRRDLPRCTKCLAGRGDPCRRPGGRTTATHVCRLEDQARFARAAPGAVTQGPADLDALEGEIKDAIDRLAEVTSPERRLEMALKLVEYLGLHYTTEADGHTTGADGHTTGADGRTTEDDATGDGSW